MGMPIYGMGHRPYENLSDADLAVKRKAALEAEPKDMRLIVDLNTETQLRQLLAGGAQIMQTPKARRRR